MRHVCQLISVRVIWYSKPVDFHIFFNTPKIVVNYVVAKCGLENGFSTMNKILIKDFPRTSAHWPQKGGKKVVAPR